MDPFFFRNRLSAWADGELPPKERQEFERAMESAPELRQEAELFLGRLEQLRALKLTAPPRIMEAALRLPPPKGGVSLAGYGLFALVGLGLALMLWPESSIQNDAAAETPTNAEDVSLTASPSPSTSEKEVASTVEVSSNSEVTSEAEVPPPIENPPGAELPPEAARWVPGAERPPGPKRSSSSNPKGHARMKIISVGPAIDAVPEEGESTPTRAPTAPFRYLLVPESPDTVLRSLQGLVTRLGGQFLRTDGSAKAPYPLDPGAKDRVLLKVSAANLAVLVQNLSSMGAVSVIAQPDSVPPSGMVGVYVEVEAP